MNTAGKLSFLSMPLILLLAGPAWSAEQTLLQETFDDANLTARGWYDGSPKASSIDTVEHIAGSTASMKFHWLAGGTKPNTADGDWIYRHSIAPTSQVYLSYWIKHSANWVGSGRPYHPHVFYFVNNLESAYVGPAFTTLTTYVEENQGFPQVAIQDGVNVDKTKIGVDLTNVTENRSISGCNGIQPVGQYSSDCYANGSDYWNGLAWKGPSALFFNTSQKTQWHFVEAYFQLNTITSGKGQADGVVRMWVDGALIIDHSNVRLRTAKNSTLLFNQFMIGPWIGDGSPVDQTFWIDNLTIATARPASSGAVKPPPPRMLQVR